MANQQVGPTFPEIAFGHHSGRGGFNESVGATGGDSCSRSAHGSSGHELRAGISTA